MSYAIIQPPFALKFPEMPRKELKAYFNWFLGQITDRVAVLEREINATPGFSDWRADRAPQSLLPLGEWFAGQVKTRPRTPEEIAEIQAASSFPIAIPEQELTNRTFSLAMDIGMYLSEVFLKTYPSLKWEQPLGGKRFVDYGQPSLGGFGNRTLNPVGIVVTFAYGLASKKRTGARLREIFDIWSKMVGPTT
jgi:hypothetical protein